MTGLSHRRFTALLLLLCTYYLTLMTVGSGPDLFDPGNEERWYAGWDSDSYSRALQLLTLFESGDWYGRTIELFNYPFGLEMHWSRAIDLPLAAGSGLLILLGIAPRLAIEVWGMVWCGPVMLALLIGWQIRALASDRTVPLPRYLWLLFPLVTLSQPSLESLFRPGFIDHHSALILLQLVVLALLLDRLNANPVGSNHARWLGVVTGLALWVSSETLLLLLLPIALLWLMAVVIDGERWRDEGREAGIALLATTLLALLVERSPGEWLLVEYDRLSVVHLMLALAGALLVHLPPPANWRQLPGMRLLWLMVSSAILMALLFGLFPGLAGHPQQDLGPLVSALLDGQPGERPYIGYHPAAQRLEWLLRDLGPLLLVLPWLGWRLLRQQGWERRRAVVQLALLLPMVVYLMFVSRAMAMVQTLMVPLWIGALLALVDRLGRPVRRRYVVVLLVTLVATSHLLPLQLSQWRVAPRVNKELPPTCNHQSVTVPLRRLSASHPGEALLAPFWLGPMASWRSGFPTLGSPYHRNRSGIERNHWLLWGDVSHPEVPLLLREHRIGFIALCHRHLAGMKHRIEKSPQSLTANLLRHNLPPWIERFPLTEESRERITLYRVLPLSLDVVAPLHDSSANGSGHGSASGSAG